jgi:Domain of unknown function (DUF309)
MRYLVRLAANALGRDRFLASVRALAGTVGAEARNPKWTSHGALELDVFCRGKNDFDLFLSALAPLYPLVFSRDLNAAPPHESDEQLLDEARAFFNAERYWECHEALETIWRQRDGDQKRLLQGLILVCAAFVHHQKGEDDIALGVLARAAKQLDFSAPEYGGFGLVGIRKSVTDILQTGKFFVFGV